MKKASGGIAILALVTFSCAGIPLLIAVAAIAGAAAVLGGVAAVAGVAALGVILLLLRRRRRAAACAPAKRTTHNEGVQVRMSDDPRRGTFPGTTAAATGSARVGSRSEAHDRRLRPLPPPR